MFVSEVKPNADQVQWFKFTYMIYKTSKTIYKYVFTMFGFPAKR